MDGCNRLPLLLRQVQFEPLLDPAASTSAIQDERDDQTVDFALRVQKHSENYLKGRALFILSASLKGPFDSNWVNPWAEPNPTKTFKLRTISGPIVRENNRKRQNEKDLREGRAKQLRAEHANPNIYPPVADHKVISDSVLSTNDNNAKITTDKPTARTSLDIYPRSGFTPVNEGSLRPFEITEVQSVPPAGPDDAITSRPPELQSIKERAVGHVMENFPDPPSRSCSDCGSTSTSKWRKGPAGPGTLCNRCGSRFYRASKQAKDSKRKASKHKPSKNKASKVSGLLANVSPTGSPGELRPKQTRAIPKHPPLSQPELSATKMSPIMGTFAVSSSLPNARPRLGHRDVMRSLFPGGLITDASRRHGQLIDLLGDDATGRLKEILQVSNTRLETSRHSSPKRSDNRKRVMNFDTPVITQASRRNERAKGGTAEPAQIHSRANVNDAAIDQGTLQGLDDKTTEEPGQVRSVTGSGDNVEESPLVSTQALQQAHVAFQEGLTSPIAHVEAQSPRKVLQDRTNISSQTNTPLRKLSDVQDTASSTRSKHENPIPNTQALFDAFTTFASTPGSVPPTENTKTKKSKSKKRASFATDITPDAREIGEEPEGNRNTARASGSLRKSALKKNSTLSGFSMPSTPCHEHKNGGDTQEEGIEAFLRDADSLLGDIQWS